MSSITPSKEQVPYPSGVLDYMKKEKKSVKSMIPPVGN
jgi:hypothetical protein